MDGLLFAAICPPSSSSCSDLLLDFPLRVQSEVVIAELRCRVQQSAIQRQASGARRQRSSTGSGVSYGTGHGAGRVRRVVWCARCVRVCLCCCEGGDERRGGAFALLRRCAAAHSSRLAAATSAAHRSASHRIVIGGAHSTQTDHSRAPRTSAHPLPLLRRASRPASSCCVLAP